MPTHVYSTTVSKTEKKEINLHGQLVKTIWALKRLLPYNHCNDVNDDGNILECKLEKRKQDDKVQVAYGNNHMELLVQDGNIVTAMTLFMDPSLLCVNTGRRHFHTCSLLILTQSL